MSGRQQVGAGALDFTTCIVVVDCAAMYQHNENISDVSTRKISSADMNRIQQALENAILDASGPLPAPNAWVSIHKSKPRRSSAKAKSSQDTSLDQPKTVRIPPLAVISATQADTIPAVTLPCASDLDDLFPPPPHTLTPNKIEETKSESSEFKEISPNATSDTSEVPDASSVSVVVPVDVIVSDSPPPVRTVVRQKLIPNQIHKSTPHAITLPLSGRAVWIAALALLGAIGGFLAQTW